MDIGKVECSIFDYFLESFCVEIYPAKSERKNFLERYSCGFFSNPRTKQGNH